MQKKQKTILALSSVYVLDCVLEYVFKFVLIWLTGDIETITNISPYVRLVLEPHLGTVVMKYVELVTLMETQPLLYGPSNRWMLRK